MNIATIAKKTKPIFKKNHVTYAAVFGSHSRGDARSDSDIDLLVRFDKKPGLFGLLQLEKELSSALGKKVDLATENSLHRLIKPNVAKDLKNIYEE